MTTQLIRQSPTTSQRLFVPASFPSVPRPSAFASGPAVPPPPPANSPAGAAAGPASADSQGGPSTSSTAARSPQNQLFWTLDLQISKARADLSSATTGHERSIARKELEELTAMLEAELLLTPKPITDHEWSSSRATRPCIVQNWFYEDVGHLAAPGGVGKTTLLLFQAIHTVLDRELFGYEIRNCNPIVFLTAEDDRGTLIARLRCMCQELELTQEDTNWVRRNIIILDVSGMGIKLTKVEKDVVVPSDIVSKLIEKLKPIGPSMLFIDPAVSFGVGESRVNDAEQGLIDAGRRIRNDVGCGVLYVHHTGKQNGREKTLDQYSGRGGSALADGSRMVHVMQSMTPQEWTAATGDILGEDEAGIVYARPKVTWAPPNQPPIYLKRAGYLFTRHNHIGSEEGAKVVLEGNAARVELFLREGWPKNERFTSKSLEATKVVKPRDALREAVAHLLAHGKIVEESGLSSGGRPPKLLRPRDGS